MGGTRPLSAAAGWGVERVSSHAAEPALTSRFAAFTVPCLVEHPRGAAFLRAFEERRGQPLELARLNGPEVRVQAVGFNEVVVGARLDDPIVVEYDDAVGVSSVW